MVPVACRFRPSKDLLYCAALRHTQVASYTGLVAGSCAVSGVSHRLRVTAVSRVRDSHSSGPVEAGATWTGTGPPEPPLRSDPPCGHAPAPGHGRGARPSNNVVSPGDGRRRGVNSVRYFRVGARNLAWTCVGWPASTETRSPEPRVECARCDLCRPFQCTLVITDTVHVSTSSD